MVFTCNKALVVAFLFVAKKMKMIFLKLKKSNNLLIEKMQIITKKLVLIGFILY